MVVETAPRAHGCRGLMGEGVEEACGASFVSSLSAFARTRRHLASSLRAALATLRQPSARGGRAQRAADADEVEEVRRRGLHYSRR